MQPVAEVLPSVLVPALQVRQALAWAAAAYVPGSQAVHSDARGRLMDPAGHTLRGKEARKRRV